jgi:phage-related protein
MGANFDVTAVLKANVTDFSSGLKQAQTSIQNLKSQASASLDKVSESLSSFGASATKLGAGLTAGLTAPAVAGVTKIIKSYADLEQSLGGVETLFKDNGTSAIGLAKKYNITAQEAQNLYDTMEEKGANVIANANKAFKTAGVSANDYMQQVTSFSATLLQGLGGDTEKAAQYADKALVQMADNANKMGTNMSDIQNAYQGFAKDNYTMLDNLKLGYGGTAGEMARLVNESGVLNGEFEATAQNVKDIPFHTLIEAIGITQDRLGITGTTAKEASETVSGSFYAMKAAAENFVAGLGHDEADIAGLMEDLKDTILTFKDNVVRVLLTIWDNLPLEPWQKWTGLIATLAGPALIAVGSVASGIAKMITAFKVISGAVSSLSSLFTFAEGGSSIFSALAGAIGAVSSTVLIVIAVVTALIAVLVGVYNTSEDFRNKVNSAWEAVKGAITSAVQEIASFVSNIWGSMTSWWQENHELIERVATKVWNQIKTVVETVTNFLAPIIEATWNAIVATVGSAWNIIKLLIGENLDAILTFFKAFLQILDGDWSGAWETLKEGAARNFENAKQLLGAIWDGIVQFFQSGLDFLKAIWDATWSVLSVVVIPIWDFIKNVIDTGMNAINLVISTTLTTVQTLWDTTWNAIMAFVEPIWTTISTIITNALTSIWTYIQSAMNVIGTVFSSAWEIIKATFAAVLLTIYGLVTGNFDLVKEAISNAWAIIQARTSEAWNAITTFLSGIWESIKSAVMSAWEYVKTTIQNAIELTKQTIMNVWNNIVSYLKGVLDNIKASILSTWENVKSTVTNAVENIKNAVVNGWNNLVSTITGAGPRIVSSVSSSFSNAISSARSFVSSAINVGHNLIMGFVNGVRNAAGALINSVTSAVSGAINGAKRLLGIHSPSRVFRQIGEYTGEGFTIGVDGQASAVMKSVGSMAQEAIDAFTGKDLAGTLQSELNAVDGQLGRLTGYDTSVDFNGGTITVGQQSADIVLKMGNTTYRAFTEDITSAQEMELTLASY